MKSLFHNAILFCLVLCPFSAAIAAGASPRERLLMDFNWRFQLQDPPEVANRFDFPEVADLAKTSADYATQDAALDARRLPATDTLGSNVSYVQNDFDDSSWQQIDLPHDWKVALPFDRHANEAEGFKALAPWWNNTIGWYRRRFNLPAADKGKALWIEFDGVFRNSLVWINGHCLGRNLSGYSSFYYDISKYANPGGSNELVVRVDATRTEGWFYEGAGIYRHVWLVKTSPVHVAHWGTYVTSDVNGADATTHIQTTLTNQSPTDATCSLISAVLDADGKSIAELRTDGIKLTAGAEQIVQQAITFPNAKLWSIQTPYMYKLVSTIVQDGPTADDYQTPFGVRTLKWDADQGFFLNGEHVEINGTCNHQDHAGVGSALPDRLIDFRVEKLKEMGANAYRMSHNDPTPELLDACDRLGMLVLDEHREMGLTPEILDQLKRLVVRDRNHPSIFLWSIGNEEWRIQGSPAGTPIARRMQDVVHLLDPTRLCTVPMSGGDGGGFSLAIDVQGFNYIHNSMPFDEYHRRFPHQPSIGTEEASTTSTRGEYRDDSARVAKMAYDLKSESWGTTAEDWWPHYLKYPSVAGAFVWTGFDYRGEPTPYHWPAINSQFGIMDTCGFPKDIYYYYQANWSDKPLVHLFPHWNWPGHENNPIDVWAFSNCDEVELFVNGQSAGKVAGKKLTHFEWHPIYQPGVIEARGYIAGRQVADDTIETTGAPAAIKLIPDRLEINADGRDISAVTVQVLDDHGRIVPESDNLVNFQIKGARIIGVGNGNPGCLESDKEPRRSVFHGLAQVIVQSDRRVGPISLTATAGALKPATVAIDSQSCLMPPTVP